MRMESPRYEEFELVLKHSDEDWAIENVEHILRAGSEVSDSFFEKFGEKFASAMRGELAYLLEQEVCKFICRAEIGQSVFFKGEEQPIFSIGEKGDVPWGDWAIGHEEPDWEVGNYLVRVLERNEELLDIDPSKFESLFEIRD